MKTRTCYLSQMVPRSYSYEKYSWNNELADWNPNPYQSISYTSLTGRLERHTIEYDDTKRTGKTKTTRACDHSVIVAETRGYPMQIYLSFTDHSKKGVMKRQAEDYYGEYSVPVPDLSSEHLEALEFFKSGCVKQELSLLNSIWELKEIKQIAGPLGNSIHRWSKSDPFNAHLWWSFGIAPMMSDMEKLVGIMKGLKAKLAWLRKNQGKPVKVKFSKDLSTSTLPARVVSEWGIGRTEYEITSHKCTYTAYAIIVYDVQELSDLELQAKVLLHQMGGDKPLSILWQGTPWSFVVDWFVRVGDWLDRLQGSIELPYKFLDVGHYVKIESTRLIRNVWYYPLKGYEQKQVSQVDHYKRFYRRPGLPVSLPSLDLGDPGMNQLALGISLFATKML